LLKWLIVFILIFSNILFAEPSGWEKASTIIEKDGYQPSIAVAKKHLYVSYTKNIDNSSEIFFIHSTNEGDTWFKEKKISSTGINSENPIIHIFNNILYVFWVDFRDGNNEIYFCFSQDPSGNKVSSPVNITSDKSDSVNPVVGFTGEKIFLIWSDDRTGDYELFCRAYDIKEKEWNDPVQITEFSGGSFSPSLLTIMDDLYVSWQQKDGNNWKIMASQSAGGESWSAPRNISLGLNNAYSPVSIVSPDGPAILFQGIRDLQPDLFSSTFDLMDEKWNIPLSVTSDLAMEKSPYLVNSLNELDLFYIATLDTGNNIIHQGSPDKGVTWQEKNTLSETGNSIKNYKVAYNTLNDNTYLVWEKDGGTIRFIKKDRFCTSPRILHSSHKEDKWSFKKDVKIKWTAEDDSSGIKDYAYILDKESTTNPELFEEGHPVSEAVFNNIKDGIWYFHLKSRDNSGNISKPVHYKIMINSQLFSSSEKYYVIKYGDTLWDVAKAHFNKAETYKKLAEYNDIDDPDWIYPHQIIRIPSEKYLGSEDSK